MVTNRFFIIMPEGKTWTTVYEKGFGTVEKLVTKMQLDNGRVAIRDSMGGRTRMYTIQNGTLIFMG